MGHVSDIPPIVSTSKIHTQTHSDRGRDGKRETRRQRDIEIETHAHIKTQPFRPATHIARIYSSPLFDMTFESYLICGFCSCFWIKIKHFLQWIPKRHLKLQHFPNYAIETENEWTRDREKNGENYNHFVELRIQVLFILWGNTWVISIVSAIFYAQKIIETFF